MSRLVNSQGGYLTSSWTQLLSMEIKTIISSDKASEVTPMKYPFLFSTYGHFGNQPLSSCANLIPLPVLLAGDLEEAYLRSVVFCKQKPAGYTTKNLLKLVHAVQQEICRFGYLNIPLDKLPRFEEEKPRDVFSWLGWYTDEYTQEQWDILSEDPKFKDFPLGAEMFRAYTHTLNWKEQKAPWRQGRFL